MILKKHTSQDYISKNSLDFYEKYKKDEWNYLIFLRIFYFLNIQNLSLVEKRIDNNKFFNLILLFSFNESSSLTLKSKKLLYLQGINLHLKQIFINSFFGK